MNLDMSADGLWFHCHIFFFNDAATTEIYTLSLHDALPISVAAAGRAGAGRGRCRRAGVCLGGVELGRGADGRQDRKSTRLNSSHSQISYAVFCLKKKKKNIAINNHVRLNIKFDCLTQVAAS